MEKKSVAKPKKVNKAVEEKPKKALKHKVVKKVVHSTVKKTKEVLMKSLKAKTKPSKIEATSEPIVEVKVAQAHHVKEPVAPKVVKEMIKPVHKESVLPASVKLHEKPKEATYKEHVVKTEAPKIVQPAVVQKAKEQVQAATLSTARFSEAKIIEIDIPISVKDLSVKLQEKTSVLLKKLMDMGVMMNLNQFVGEELIEKLKKEFNFEIKRLPTKEEQLVNFHEADDDPKTLKLRSPVVTFMGHVDHGKTSLLDAIRKTKLVDKEHGGITQHIGAYEVNYTGEKSSGKVSKITFLDTPGHEAFTALRARGAKSIDIVVLVVAADDGVMPQTIEAIDHAKLAEVPIIVAVNKIDKPGANPDKVKKQLAELGLNPEDWGGKTIFVNVSAKTNEGIDALLEMILLEAEMMELKANYDRPASGVVLDAKISKEKGNVVTLLVQKGTLKINDTLLVGRFYGKIRAMFDEFGRSKIKAEPSNPVGILGFAGLPESGEKFFVVSDERLAKEISEKRLEEYKVKQLVSQKKFTLEDLSEQIKQGQKIKELRLILKADVQSSLEAILKTLEGLTHEEIKLHILHQGCGTINTSDVLLATVSNALIIGFNVNIDALAKEKSDLEQIEIRTYNIIYELANDLQQALEGMLEKKFKKIFLGRAFVKQVFKTSKSGIIAGCMVQKGKITRNAQASLVRNGQVVYEGKITSLKRFKDNVKEVGEGLECGISLNTEDIRAEDIIDVFQSQEIQRSIKD